MTETQVRKIISAYKALESNKEVLNAWFHTKSAGVHVTFPALLTLGVPTFTPRVDSYFSHTASVIIDNLEFYAVCLQADYDHYTAGVSPASA